MARTKMKCSDLKEPTGMYVRHVRDSTHVSHLKRALEAGETFPPVVVSQRGNIIVDGVARWEAIQQVYGDSAPIACDVVAFKSKKEMLLAMVRANTAHGKNLSAIDRAHVITLAKKFKVSLVHLATAMRLPLADVERLAKKRVKKVGSGYEAIAAPLEPIFDESQKRRFTAADAAASKHVSALSLNAKIKEVMLWLVMDWWRPDDAITHQAIVDLRDEIDRFLQRNPTPRNP